MIPSNIEDYYRLHSRFYNATRWAFLFGRNAVKNFFPELSENARILDLGCGTGKHLKQLHNQYPKAKIAGIDLSEDMLSQVTLSIADSVELINRYYTKDSFDENEFDLIVCSYSLTMMPELKDIIRNLKTHLKPSGQLLVVDFDSTPFIWFSNWMKMNHVSFEPNLFQLLKQHFDVESHETGTSYFGLYSYSISLLKCPLN